MQCEPDKDGGDILRALYSDRVGQERVDDVFAKVDHWLCRHGESFRRKATARANFYGINGAESEDLVQKALEQASEFLQDQALGGKRFRFTGKPAFMGYLMCVVGVLQKWEPQKGGVIRDERKRKREAAKYPTESIELHGEIADGYRDTFVRNGETTLNVNVNDFALAISWQTYDWRNAVASLEPLERAIVGLWAGLCEEVSVATIAQHLAWSGLSSEEIERLTERAELMAWKQRKDHRLTYAELADLFDMPRIRVRRTTAAVKRRLHEAHDAKAA